MEGQWSQLRWRVDNPAQASAGLTANGGEGESLHASCSFYGCRLEDFFDDLLFGSLGAAFGGEHEAMAEGGDGDSFDVVGQGEVPSFQQGVSLGKADEAQGCAGRCAEMNGKAVSGGVRQSLPRSR